MNGEVVSKMERLISGLQCMTALVFALSCLKKVRLLSTGAARWHPILIRRPLLRPWASQALAASLALDAVIAVGILAVPAPGAVVGGAILMAYTVVGMRSTDEGGSCACLGRVLDTRTTAGFVFRNSVLLLAVAIVAVRHASGIELRGVIAGVVLAALLAVLIRGVDALAPASNPSAPGMFRPLDVNDERIGGAI